MWSSRCHSGGTRGCIRFLSRAQFLCRALTQAPMQRIVHKEVDADLIVESHGTTIWSLRRTER